MEELRFSKLHVFRYSPRAGTAEAALPDDVSPDTKKTRSKRLIAAGNEIRARFLASHLSSPLEVLVEDERMVGDASVSSGQTDDYVRVWFEGTGLLGSVATVEGARVRADGLEARLAATLPAEAP